MTCLFVITEHVCVFVKVCHDLWLVVDVGPWWQVGQDPRGPEHEETKDYAFPSRNNHITTPRKHSPAGGRSTDGQRFFLYSNILMLF